PRGRTAGPRALEQPRPAAGPKATSPPVDRLTARARQTQALSARPRRRPDRHRRPRRPTAPCRPPRRPHRCAPASLRRLLAGDALADAAARDLADPDVPRRRACPAGRRATADRATRADADRVHDREPGRRPAVPAPSTARAPRQRAPRRRARRDPEPLRLGRRHARRPRRPPAGSDDAVASRLTAKLAT